MVWSCLVPKRLVLDGLIKDAVPGAWLWSSNGIPCTILDILEIWGDFFCTAKGTIKSAAPAPPKISLLDLSSPTF